jgi:anhydro-N-acetylmuramic acid kinase
MMTGRDDGLARLRDYLTRDEHLVVGLMTGTSADGVDAALVRFKGVGIESTCELLAYRETPIERALRHEVLEVASAASLEPERLLRLDKALGERYAAAVLELLGSEGVDPRRVDAIGSHGQTVRHLPRHSGGGEALSLQIGSAPVLAERTGIAVVSDFRSRDAAAGGEGAPLVPLVDWWLFRSPDESRVLLNLGGIANLTYLPRGCNLDGLTAFDTGPGNVVLDSLVQLDSGGAVTHDEGGAGAARGRMSEALLTELLADPFFSLPPPRSTGREHFGERYARKLREVGLAMELSQDDILATAVELTAASVAEAVERFVKMKGSVDRVYVSGGGTRNTTLMTALERRLLPVPLMPLGHLGIPPEAKEALAFAFLAHQTLCGQPGNVPGATGAARPVILGQITPGPVHEMRTLPGEGSNGAKDRR